MIMSKNISQPLEPVWILRVNLKAQYHVANRSVTEKIIPTVSTSAM